MHANRPKTVLLIITALLLGLICVRHQAVTAAAGDLFISEYIEGSSNNKAIEIYNGTGTAVNLATSGYEIYISFNGGSTEYQLPLTGTVANSDVFVLADHEANASILAQADQTDAGSFFNGDDAILLRKNGVTIDSIGQLGTDPGSEWGTGDVSTKDNTLRRKDGVCAGDVNSGDAFDPAGEWDGFAQNTTDGLGTHTANCDSQTDIPPTVTSLSATSSSPIALDASFVVVFSEPVTTSAGWYNLNCSKSGVVAAADSGNGNNYTINPTLSLDFSETCTLTVTGAFVTDVDGTPDQMVGTSSAEFTTIAESGDECGDPADLIHTIQGNGSASAFDGEVKTIEGVVVGDYQANGQLSGFFVQEEDSDTDSFAETSEGIFVFDSSAAEVAEGQVVRVTGTVKEFFNLTELTTITGLSICGTAPLPTAVAILLPVPALVNGVDYLERYEGMLVNVEQELFVTEVYNLGRGGELTLSSTDRLYQPTNVVAPGAAAEAMAETNLLNQIVLDDMSQGQNPDQVLYPAPAGLSALNPVRGGDTVKGISGVLTYSWSGWPGSTNAYRIHPLRADALPSFIQSNPRTVTPVAVGGTLKVVSFNVLNFFNGDGEGGGFPTTRGADTAAELIRQKAKILKALVALDADVIGLIEIENDGYGSESAIQELVDDLNGETSPGLYKFVDPGVAKIGSDQIAVGFIYKSATVAEAGTAVILDSSVDATFIDTKNRPVLAQTFREISSGESVTIAVNHLKSKGSDCDSINDPDTGDGQGNCNLTRTSAAAAMAKWLETNPTGIDDPDILIMGDLNAYMKEDPITTIESAGYTNLLDRFSQTYSYVFFGQWGSLDHALASSELNGQVTGTTVWHINSDEARSLDYNEEFKSAAQLISFFNEDPYRSSDHDPIVIGLDLGEPEPPSAVIYLPIVVSK